MSNSYTIYRIEPDGSETVINCVGDEMEIPGAILADQAMIDYNAGYHAEIIKTAKKGDQHDGSDSGTAQVQESAEGDGV